MILAKVLDFFLGKQETDEPGGARNTAVVDPRWGSSGVCGEVCVCLRKSRLYLE